MEGEIIELTSCTLIHCDFMKDICSTFSLHFEHKVKLKYIDELALRISFELVHKTV